MAVRGSASSASVSLKDSFAVSSSVYSSGLFSYTVAIYALLKWGELISGGGGPMGGVLVVLVFLFVVLLLRVVLAWWVVCFFF